MSSQSNVGQVPSFDTVLCCTRMCPIPLPPPTATLAGYNNLWASGQGDGIKGFDTAAYDVYASDNSAPVGSPRTLYWRVNDLTINGINYIPATGNEFGIAVPNVGWRELLRDWVNSLIAAGDPLIYPSFLGGWGVDVDPSMVFSITLQDGFDDHAGGVIWATEFHFDGNGAGPAGIDWVVGAFNSQPMPVTP